MPGMRVASTDDAGWTIETVELALTGRTRRRGGRAVPVGDGAQLLVRRHGFVVAYCAGPDDLAALGVDMSRVAVVTRWLAPPPSTYSRSRGRRDQFERPLCRECGRCGGRPITQPTRVHRAGGPPRLVPLGRDR